MIEEETQVDLDDRSDIPSLQQRCGEMENGAPDAGTGQEALRNELSEAGRRSLAWLANLPPGSLSDSSSTSSGASVPDGARETDSVEGLHTSPEAAMRYEVWHPEWEDTTRGATGSPHVAFLLPQQRGQQ